MTSFNIDDSLTLQTKEEYNRISDEVGQFPKVLQKALSIYMEDADLTLNARLRSFQGDSKNLIETNPVIKHIYDAFRTVSPTKKDMIVYRGYKPPTNDLSFPGYHTFDKGFVSTSINYSISTYFRNDDCCTSIILIPAGSKVLCLGKVKSVLFKDEQEVLLPFNAKFELLKTYSKGVYFLKYVQSPLENMSTGEICNLILESDLDDTKDFSQTLNHLFDKCGRLTRSEKQTILRTQEEALIKSLTDFVKAHILDMKTYLKIQLFLEKFSKFASKEDIHLYIFKKLQKSLYHYYHDGISDYQAWNYAGEIYLQTSDLSIIKALLESNQYGEQPNLIYKPVLPENYIEYLELVYAYSNKNLLRGLWNNVLEHYKENLNQGMSKDMAEAIISFLIKYDIPVVLNPVIIYGNLKVFKNFFRIPGFVNKLPEILPSVWQYAAGYHMYTDERVRVLLEHNIPFIASDDVKAILEERMQYVCRNCEMYKKLLSN